MPIVKEYIIRTRGRLIVNVVVKTVMCRCNKNIIDVELHKGSIFKCIECGGVIPVDDLHNRDIEGKVRK